MTRGTVARSLDPRIAKSQTSSGATATRTSARQGHGVSTAGPPGGGPGGVRGGGGAGAGSVSVETLPVRGGPVRWGPVHGWKGSYLTVYASDPAAPRGLSAEPGADGAWAHVYAGGFAEAGIACDACPAT